MLRSIEATIETNGNIHLNESVHLLHACRAIVTIIEEHTRKISKWGPEHHHCYSKDTKEQIMTFMQMSRREWTSDDEWEPVYPESSFPFAELPIEMAWEVCTLIVSREKR